MGGRIGVTGGGIIGGNGVEVKGQEKFLTCFMLLHCVYDDSMIVLRTEVLRTALRIDRDG